MASRNLRLVNGAAAQTAPGAPATDRLTIERLAAETGMSVRNIREHQARGLLPPPEVRERVGLYGPDHVARLRAIQELQAEGFNLRGIKRLLDRAEGPATELLGLRRLITAPFETEQPQVFTAEELGARFNAPPEGPALDKAVRMGILVPIGGGRYEAPSPALLEAADEAIESGIPLDAALAVVAKVQRSCESIARAFVKLVLDEVFSPFAEEGFPRERWPEVVESIERLRPMASKALLAVFRQTMALEVEAAFGKELRRRSRD
jgi:DNA-binding transcriptional MerR regulator